MRLGLRKPKNIAKIFVLFFVKELHVLNPERSEQTSTSQVGKINDQLLSILLRLSTCKTSPNYTEKTFRFSAYVEQLKMFIHE